MNLSIHNLKLPNTSMDIIFQQVRAGFVHTVTLISLEYLYYN